MKAYPVPEVRILFLSPEGEVWVTECGLPGGELRGGETWEDAAGRWADTLGRVTEVHFLTALPGEERDGRWRVPVLFGATSEGELLGGHWASLSKLPPALAEIIKKVND